MTLVSTHPWINFSFDLRVIPEPVWVLLGECSSKIEHVSGAPLRPGTQRYLNQVFLAKGAHATTAIEGNTLTEEQVQQRIEGGLELPQSQEYLGQEIDNVIKVYNQLIGRVAEGAPLRLGPDDLNNLNKMVLDGLDLEEGVVPGGFRGYVVTVGDYRSPGPEHNDDLVRQLCEWLNQPVWEEKLGTRFVLPILKSILAHLYIAWIHPFGDGNGRTARLLEFDILTRAGVPTICAHLLSNHYNRTRTAYYRALSAARGSLVDFVAYAVQGFADGLREQIDIVETQQIDVAWRDYVYRSFDKEPSSPARSRRRQLVFALSSVQEPVSRADITRLTPDLAATYADKGRKTVSRDINALIYLELIRHSGDGLVANKEIIRAFLPLTNVQPPVEGSADLPRGGQITLDF